MVGTFPISVDFKEFERLALETSVAARAADIRGQIAGDQLILGIDRLDYTKGIPERLLAFRSLLENIRISADASLWSRSSSQVARTYQDIKS